MKAAINISKINILALLVICLGINTTSSNNMAIAQKIAHNNSSVIPVANINEVKTFVYSWFALLDRQVSEISLLKFLDKNNLTMEFPEMTVNNPDDFNEWYSGVEEAISSNTHDVRLVEVTPKGNGKFDVMVEVNWQAQTREGETINQAYQQQWKVVSDRNRRLLIQEYLVEEIN